MSPAAQTVLVELFFQWRDVSIIVSTSQTPLRVSSVSIVA